MICYSYCFPVLYFYLFFPFIFLGICRYFQLGSFRLKSLLAHPDRQMSFFCPRFYRREVAWVLRHLGFAWWFSRLTQQKQVIDYHLSGEIGGISGSPNFPASTFSYMIWIWVSREWTLELRVGLGRMISSCQSSVRSHSQFPLAPSVTMTGIGGFNGFRLSHRIFDRGFVFCHS